MNKFFFITIVIKIFLLSNVYGQKNYNINILIEKNKMDFNSLEINFIDGNKIHLIKMNDEGFSNENILANFKNPVLEFNYKAKNNKNNSLRFFISEFKCSLKIEYDTITDNIFLDEGYGILTFAHSGERDFNTFAKKELSDLELLSRKSNYLINAADTVNLNKLTIYINELRDKKIKYIRTNPKSKYSLWLFIDDILGNEKYANAYQNQLYKKYLQPNYINTFEDTFILEKLDKYRLSIHSIAPYINVPFTDLKGITHKLKDFNGKYLLIILWATWCVPCVEEIPKLKELYSKHFNDIEFISFSTDRDKLIHNRFIKGRDINWLNIFGRYDFTQSYGANKSIPQLYVLDKKSKIIYSRTFYEDYDLSKLTMLMDKIMVAEMNNVQKDLK